MLRQPVTTQPSQELLPRLGRARRPRRWRRLALLGVPLLTLVISLVVLPGRPASTAALDEAHLELALALAEHDEARERWHASRQTAARSRTTEATPAASLVDGRVDTLGRRTTAAAELATQAERQAQVWQTQAEEASHVELLVEQVLALVHPPETHPAPPLQWPVAGALVSGYGLRAWPDFGAVHPGLDIVNVPGTPIGAAADGVVVAVRRDRDQGNAVVIEHDEQAVHPGTWRTVYGHLAEITVVERERVRAGDQVGTLGNTGVQSTGPHLHFEVRIEDQPVDPRRWLP
jgi:murein DD-endopeptidase MepM/ murein hydrolase activator NlpD